MTRSPALATSVGCFSGFRTCLPDQEDAGGTSQLQPPRASPEGLRALDVILETNLHVLTKT